MSLLLTPRRIDLYPDGLDVTATRSVAGGSCAPDARRVHWSASSGAGFSITVTSDSTARLRPVGPMSGYLLAWPQGDARALDSIRVVVYVP